MKFPKVIIFLVDESRWKCNQIDWNSNKWKVAFDQSLRPNLHRNVTSHFGNVFLGFLTFEMRL